MSWEQRQPPAIDVTTEAVIDAAEAGRELQRIRGGTPPHIDTVRRWMRVGLHGVRLDSVRIAGGRYTTREAIVRFIQELTALDAEPYSKPRDNHPRPRDRGAR